MSIILVMTRSERETVIKFLKTAGARGGLTTARRYGKKSLKEWGGKGGRARAEKFGPETLRRWARLGGRPVEKTRQS